MKKMKMYLAALLSATMVLGMGTMLSSAATITVDNASSENYEAYKIFDAETVSDVTVYSLPAGSAIVDQIDSTLFTKITDGEIVKIKRKDGVSDAKILSWVKSLDLASVEKTTVAAKDGSAEFTSLDSGYYYVTTTSGSLVAITSVDDSKTVVDKNKIPNWDPEDPSNPPSDDDDPSETELGKFVKESDTTEWTQANSASIGSALDFMINFYAPLNNQGNVITEYTLTDVMETGLTYDKDSITVSFYGGEEISDATIDTSADDQFVVTIPVGDDFPVDAHISVTYTGALDTDAEFANDNAASLSWLEYDPTIDPENPDDPDNPTPGTPENPTTPDDNDVPDDSITTTYTYEIDVNKRDGAVDGTLIGGAQFKLFLTPKGSENDTELPLKLVDGRYVPASEGETGVTVKVGSSGEMLGKACIAGLKAGTYYLEETIAPVGYNGLTDRVVITLGGTDSDNAVDVENIVNNAGTILPSTGGRGTAVFYIIGGVLVAGAVVLLIARKRMGGKEA